MPPPSRAEAETKPAKSAEKEIDFSAIGGKCVRKASEHPMAEPTKKVGGGHDDVSKTRPDRNIELDSKEVENDAERERR